VVLCQVVAGDAALVGQLGQLQALAEQLGQRGAGDALQVVEDPEPHQDQ
jgi:hypothetical protein